MKEAVGGNAPVMATRFSKEGCDVFLGSTISEDLRQLANFRPEIKGMLTLIL